MRFTVFLALVVATFVACISLTNAEAVAESRSLRAQQNIGAAAAAFKNYKSPNIATKFVEEMTEVGIRGTAARMAAGAKESAKLTTKQIEMLTKQLTATVKKDRTKWQKIRKALLITLGVGVGGTIIYQVGKAAFGTKATTAPATDGSL
ncbi:hypothetical protein PHYSODRAFT_288707 [Phytophthora sojae]|uniref:RxLR effector protein n=1 Tax=Phytophthora sojae (strain P6497) TaxID=1094619 RepID=G5A724_PHYSP|nr:hypothetical protein PHYSODRAFT_288707 [Phytophthora sojae]EGZ09129.1 hypothetical protein PHYSODRAFT_288707 [Phytophthora sojae]|eukprot:XP_009535762.1 hypothetical protein PHYSODRAFT_288707 [Phytophthora sojae]